MSRRLCTLLCIALVSALTFAVAGCGGGGKDRSAQDVLNRAFAGNSASVQSGRLKLALDANVKGIAGINGPVALSLDGPFKTAKSGQLPLFDFTLSLTSSGSTLSAGAVSTGDKGWLKFQGQSFSVTPQLFNQFKQGYLAAQKNSKSKGSTPTLSALGIDPRRWLVNPKKQDAEDVAGTKSDHVSADVDVPKLLQDVDTLLKKADTAAAGQAQLSAAQQQKIRDSVKAAHIEVFAGQKDGKLRRLLVDLKLTQGTVKVTLELADLGEDVSVQAPANARPLSELLSAVQGGATGSTSTGTGTTGSGTTAAPTTTQAAPAPTATVPSGTSGQSRYLQCRQAAGTDIAKIQACASLLNAG